ncbi:hypothetical protein EBI00_09355 [Marinomonas hwangdonensis]|uniref:Uncharacterized protein n=1 Tax=Marinomonas hwangdonensis TaxID=1053647 RepID=A0A3M8Q692_9GAMM|nr:hypothetical protein [Marinomonas hwangdonensis]RNF51151.1 hypothetical protein EBI00_09355 [Marinomonas hwangdonensis]
MSGSLPHVIALANHTFTPVVTPGYTTFDLRSDEDTNMAALNARNAKASSDHIVTLSEEGQALAQRDKKAIEDDILNRQEDLSLELEEEFIEDDEGTIVHATHKEVKIASYQEEQPAGKLLDQIV